jgi:hypothetical protein
MIMQLFDKQDKTWERNKDVKRDRNLQLALLRAHYNKGGKANAN